MSWLPIWIAAHLENIRRRVYPNSPPHTPAPQNNTTSPASLQIIGALFTLFAIIILVSIGLQILGIR